MSSNPRRRNRTSPTTIILVLVLLGAVAGASRLVTPPPPEPPKPAPAPKLQTADTKAYEKARMDHYKKEMKDKEEALKGHATPVTPVTDPNAVEITNDYFRTHKAGEAGIEEVDQDVKARTAKFNAYLKEREAVQKKNPPMKTDLNAPPTMPPAPVK